MISVTGAHSGCGKTCIGEAIIRAVPIKWSAIKYTGTAFYSSLTDDENVIEEAGKDTDRLRKAGAGKVIWIQSQKEELEGLLQIALERIEGSEGVIIEGNSPAEILQPDITVFVFGDDPHHVKPSAKGILEKADYILYKEKPSTKTKAKCYNKNSVTGIKEMIDDIMSNLKD